MNKALHFTPKTIAKVFLCLVGVLLIANLIAIIFQFVYPLPRGQWFGPSFYFDNEANFPALYSSLAILFCSVLLWMIGNLKAEKRSKQSPYWKLLSGIFVFLALDEFLAIHEYLIKFTQSLMNFSDSEGSFLYFAWFIPYCSMFGLIGLFLLRFFFRLPNRSKILFATAGFIFVSGAVGMEMVGGKYWSLQGWSFEKEFSIDLTYALIVTVEELLEMLGIVVFIYALSSYYLEHIEQKYLHIHLQLASDLSQQSKPASSPVEDQPVYSTEGNNVMVNQYSEMSS